MVDFDIKVSLSIVVISLVLHFKKILNLQGVMLQMVSEHWFQTLGLMGSNHLKNRKNCINKLCDYCRII
jgi:hypothetical protein